MAGPAKEAGEEIEGVMTTATAGAAALFVLGESFVAVLVVDFAGFGRGEGVVGFGDLDEFLGGGLVAAVGGIRTSGLVHNLCGGEE